MERGGEEPLSASSRVLGEPHGLLNPINTRKQQVARDSLLVSIGAEHLGSKSRVKQHGLSERAKVIVILKGEPQG